jgi:hypothetical protein
MNLKLLGDKKRRRSEEISEWKKVEFDKRKKT